MGACHGGAEQTQNGQEGSPGARSGWLGRNWLLDKTLL